MPKKDQQAEEKKRENAAAEAETQAELPAEENPTAELEAKVAQLQEELDKKEDLLKRTAAEYDNYRKRTAREMGAISADVRAETVRQLLPVADNIERALLTQAGTEEDFRKGVEMIQTQIRSVFEQLGIEAIEETGVAFNPEIHNAVLHVEDDKMEENVVAEMLQKGYKLGGKVLRHAMVKVAN